MSDVTSARFDEITDRLESATDTSRVVGTIRHVESACARWAEGSRIVQWFLAEPDPEVVVIDLRETYTVGPILRVLERIVAGGHRLADRTGLLAVAHGLGDRIASEPLRVVGTLLVGVSLVGLAAALSAGGSIGGWLVLLGVALLATRERRSASALAETWVGRALRAAFEPPDPPERRE